MCGVAGALDHSAGGDELVSVARSLSYALRHRGPDGDGEWSESGVALVHRRLAILDPSRRGHQPMLSRDGRWVVTYNGELYNHLDVRKSLAGEWKSGSDTETLLRALESDGINAIHRFAGMFAFAAWDRQLRVLHLVRDRLGIKPLYFYRSRDRWLFASEPGAIAAAEPAARRLDHYSLASYFALGYPPCDRTLFRGVRAVLPGEVVTLQGGADEQHWKYWRLPEDVDDGRSRREWNDAFAELWPAVVRAHLLSDVPLGLFLSGGIDSSGVAVAVASATSNCRVFTASFGERNFDESEDAAKVARHLGLPLTVLPVDKKAVEECLPEVARCSDLPSCDSSSLGTWLLCRGAARHVKVVLSGDGADEILAGYATHRATELVSSPFGWLLRIVSWAVGEWIPPPRRSGSPLGSAQRASRLLKHARHGPLGAHLRWRTLLDDSSLAELTGGARRDHWMQWEALIGEYPAQPVLNQALALDVQGYLAQDELTRVDRTGMAHGLEMRVPFLDHRLVELAFQMPYAAKARGGRGKRPLREWLRRQGHQELLARPKRGFNHPVAGWLADSLGDRLVDSVASSPFATLLDRAVLERWLRRHRSGDEDRSYELWAVLFLTQWASEHGVTI